MPQVWLGSSYDSWKTTPPEEEDTRCTCSECGIDLFKGDDYWDFGNGILCEDCKDNYVEEFRHEVTEDMQYGEDDDI